MTAGYVLAIDFGTTSTVAAICRVGRTPEPVEILGDRRTPSSVAVQDGKVIVGQAAADLGTSEPSLLVRAPKRRLGDPTPIVVNGRAYRSVELVAEVLRFVYDETIRQQGAVPTRVCLTHPATWGRPRVASLLEAAAKAGIAHATTVPEPVAAALAYASDVDLPDGSRVAIYDLGGGTFDTTVLERHGSTFRVIGTPGGDPTLGGELFDELVTAALGERLDPTVWHELQVSDDPDWLRAAAAMRSEARRAKEVLTTATTTEVLLPLPAGMARLTLTRAMLEDVVGPFLEDSARLLVHGVQAAGVDPATLAAVQLVGGASRMPLIATMLAAALPGVPISQRGDPKAAVALGATLAEPSSSAIDLQRAAVRTTIDGALEDSPASLAGQPTQDTAPDGPQIPDWLKTPQAKGWAIATVLGLLVGWIMIGQNNPAKPTVLASKVTAAASSAPSTILYTQPTVTFPLPVSSTTPLVPSTTQVPTTVATTTAPPTTAPAPAPTTAPPAPVTAAPVATTAAPDRALNAEQADFVLLTRDEVQSVIGEAGWFEIPYRPGFICGASGPEPELRQGREHQLNGSSGRSFVITAASVFAGVADVQALVDDALAKVASCTDDRTNDGIDIHLDFANVNTTPPIGVETFVSFRVRATMPGRQTQNSYFATGSLGRSMISTQLFVEGREMSPEDLEAGRSLFNYMFQKLAEEFS